MKKIISEINNIFSEKTKINPQDICICSFSGGQDSVLLFIILLHLKKQWDIKIELLHFHHFWQQKNFFSTQQVWKLSFVFQNPLYIITSEIFLNTEKKARQWRQQGLERVSSLEKCNKILTGHTASDRIETAVWHLIRGTSPQGLISLKWQTTLLVQTKFFPLSKFIIVDVRICKSFAFTNTNSFAFKNVNRNLSSFKVLKKIDTNESKRSKMKFISKNKKILKNCFYSKEKKKNNFYTDRSDDLKRDTFLEKTKVLVQKENLFRIKSETFVTNRGFWYKGKIYLKKYSISSVSLKKIKTKLYKKNLQNFSFLIFNYFLFKSILGHILHLRSRSQMLCICERERESLSICEGKHKCISLENQEDQTYSFLMFNFFFSTKNLLRPLLIFHRNDITFFSKNYVLPILSDPTNQKLRWSRNRIRHQLFPLVRFFFNPNTEYLLNNFLEITIEEQKYIESVIQKIVEYWLKKHENYHDIKNQLQLFPKAIQRRLLQKVFQSYNNLQPNLIQIEILRINIERN